MSRPAASLRIRAYSPGDEASLLALHNRAYVDHAQRSAAHWEWKHQRNPLRRTDVIVAADANGNCRMVHAGVTLPAVLDGEPCLAGLHLDVAVDPDLRRGLGTARTLVDTMRRFVHEHGGGETRLIWGYPEPPLQRLGLRFGLFEVLRDVTFLVRPVGACRAAAQDGSSQLEVRKIPRFDGEADELWERCRSEIGTGVVRDASYLNWRYADHPDVRYTLFEVRDTRADRLMGLAACRVGGWQDDCLSLVEWLVPRADVSAERALLEQLTLEAKATQTNWLVCWIAGAPDLFHRFQTLHGFFAQATPYQVTYKSWSPVARRRWLHEHWYQTMGDIDFF